VRLVYLVASLRKLCLYLTSDTITSSIFVGLDDASVSVCGKSTWGVAGPT
jgi:hypothetical protein